MRGWRGALPLAVALLAMAPGLRGGFVLDDQHAILEHPAVAGEAPLVEVVTRDFWGGRLGERIPAWRPLATLSFRIDARLFGLRPLPFHVTSLLLYLLATLLVLRLGERLVSRRAALLGALLFAALPIHVEAVASLVGRADLLSLIGMLVVLLLLLPSTNGASMSSSRARMALAAIAFAAALLAKESALLLPIVLVILAHARGEARKAVPAALVLAVVAALYVGLRVGVQPGVLQANQAVDDPIAGAGLLMRGAHALQLLGAYAYITVLPIDLCTGRKYSQIAAPDWASAPLWLGGGALVLLVVVLALRDRRREQPPLALCAVVSWLLFSGLAFALPETMADRFALQPSVFVALALGRGADAWLARSSAPRARVGLLAVLAGLYTLAAGFYTTRWRDDETLLAHAVVACPDSVHDHARYATILDRSGQIAESAWHFALAVLGRQRFPARWRHPALDAEASMPAEERIRRLGALLPLGMPEADFRRGLCAALRSQALEREAQFVCLP